MVKGARDGNDVVGLDCAGSYNTGFFRRGEADRVGIVPSGGQHAQVSTRASTLADQFVRISAVARGVEGNPLQRGLHVDERDRVTVQVTQVVAGKQVATGITARRAQMCCVREPGVVGIARHSVLDVEHDNFRPGPVGAGGDRLPFHPTASMNADLGDAGRIGGSTRRRLSDDHLQIIVAVVILSAAHRRVGHRIDGGALGLAPPGLAPLALSPPGESSRSQLSSPLWAPLPAAPPRAATPL